MNMKIEFKFNLRTFLIGCSYNKEAKMFRIFVLFFCVRFISLKKEQWITFTHYRSLRQMEDEFIYFKGLCDLPIGPESTEILYKILPIYCKKKGFVFIRAHSHVFIFEEKRLLNRADSSNLSTFTDSFTDTMTILTRCQVEINELRLKHKI